MLHYDEKNNNIYLIIKVLLNMLFWILVSFFSLSIKKKETMEKNSLLVSLKKKIFDVNDRSFLKFRSWLEKNKNTL